MNPSRIALRLLLVLPLLFAARAASAQASAPPQGFNTTTLGVIDLGPEIEGMQGRVLLGPAGSPGQVDVPLRLALVQEGLEPKTIWTKLYRIPVMVPPGQSNVSFVHIEEDMTFPAPSAADVESYVIYLGFDPAGSNEPVNKKKPQVKPNKKPLASR